jgi:hypothetical protein
VPTVVVSPIPIGNVDVSPVGHAVVVFTRIAVVEVNGPVEELVVNGTPFVVVVPTIGGLPVVVAT